MLNDRYELGEVIGSGGMGTVHRAVDTRLGRVVAIKILRGGPLADAETALARMRSEARLAASIHHPGVAQVYDFAEDASSTEGLSFIVMQLVEGESLAAVLRERGPLPVEQVMSIVEQVAEGLRVAHAAGIVHRDLKPANIMLTPQGRTVLVDFGIAHSAVSEPLTATGSLLGTADYLSPEQAAGRPSTPRSDLYALGVVAYQCLTGESPFRRESSIGTALAQLNDELPELGADVPADVRDLIASLTHKNPDRRPADAAEVARRAGGGIRTPVAATARMPVPVRVPSVRRGPTMVYAGVGAVVVAVALAAFGVRQMGSDEDPAAPRVDSPTTPVATTPIATTPTTPATVQPSTVPPPTVSPPNAAVTATPQDGPGRVEKQDKAKDKAKDKGKARAKAKGNGKEKG
ncbi:MAG: serine/threonine protein kinase [Aeromicrobium sp.]|jgi:serine/threonine protein kinase|nr:serine/threonine protein kinase [Aeromicrobium sp.]